MSTTTYQCYLKVMRREILRIATKPMYLFCMVIAPLFCFLFFTTLMGNGLPTNLPAGVVGPRQHRHDTQHYPQPGRVSADPDCSALPKCHRSKTGRTARRDLFILLHSERNDRRSPCQQTAESVLLCQLFLPDCRFLTL